jgi:hypothetical protein
MYLCVTDINFYDFLLEFRTVPTVWYFFPRFIAVIIMKYFSLTFLGWYKLFNKARFMLSRDKDDIKHDQERKMTNNSTSWYPLNTFIIKWSKSHYKINFMSILFFCVAKISVSDCYLTTNEQFYSYMGIITRTS